jgi:Ca2+-binding RTX toxin-like protein
VIRGLADGDTIQALGGDDRLFGDDGLDKQWGGAGLDQLTGCARADRFLFGAAAAAPADGPRYEEILDFSRQERDRIDVTRIDADDGRSGNQAFAFLGSTPLTGARQLHVEAFDGDFLVTGSTDADAAAEFAFVVRTDLASLQAGDFLL